MVTSDIGRVQSYMLDLIDGNGDSFLIVGRL